MIIGYATRSQVIYLAVTGTLVARICDYLALMLDHTTVVPIRKPHTEVIDLRFAAPDKEITNSMPTDQESLLLRPSKMNWALFQDSATLNSATSIA